MKDKKKLILKILVPTMIAVVILSMWLMKNSSEKDVITGNQNQNELISSIPEKLQDADFSLKVSEQIDFEALAEYGLPVIADYGSDDCIPCKEMAPVLEAMNKEFAGKVFIKFADVWAYQDIANNVPIQIIPTQVLFNADGTPFVPSEKLQQEMEFVMYRGRENEEHLFTVHQGGLTEEQFRKILQEMGLNND